MRIDRTRRRTYVWIAGKWRRLHHGLVGAVFVAAGALLCWHDHADFPWTR